MSTLFLWTHGADHRLYSPALSSSKGYSYYLDPSPIACFSLWRIQSFSALVLAYTPKGELWQDTSSLCTLHLWPERYHRKKATAQGRPHSGLPSPATPFTLTHLQQQQHITLLNAFSFGVTYIPRYRYILSRTRGQTKRGGTIFQDVFLSRFLGYISSCGHFRRVLCNFASMICIAKYQYLCKINARRNPFTKRLTGFL